MLKYNKKFAIIHIMKLKILRGIIMQNTNENVIVGGKYRHYKGNEYIVVATAILENTMEEAVVYYSLKNKERYWVRPLANFLEEVNGQERFKFIGMAAEEKVSL